jgi:hypothetical protein
MGSMKFMWFNLHGGFKNVGVGYTNQIIEATGGQFIELTDLKFGTTKFPWSELLAALNTQFENPHHDNKYAAIIHSLF